MAILSKNTTYGQLIDQIRIESGILDNIMYPDEYLVREIDYAISNFYAKNANRNFYQQRATYSLSGSANPYGVDLSTTLPFPYEIIDVVYKNSGRISIKQVSKKELEELSQLTSINANSIYCSIGGDTIDIVFGDDVTIVSTNTIEVLYKRQPIQFKNFLIDRNNSLSKGLIAYYKCEDGTDSYNDYDGTPSGTTFTAGKINNGINFGSASTSCLNLGSDVVFDFERTDPFSIFFWTKFNTAIYERHFFERQLNFTTLKGWAFDMVSDGHVRFRMNNSASNRINVNAPVLNTTSWVNIGVTVDGSSNASGIKIYYNAVSQTMTTNFNNLTATTKNGTSANAVIGNISYTPNKNFNGMMDEILVYNRSLDLTEIQDIYNGGSGQTLIQNIKLTSYLDILDCDIPFIANNLIEKMRIN